MLAVGRMYLDAQLLTEAQTALVAAGKAAGRDARPFRYLGEVLLRRGDALRSEKVLARALQLGHSDPETRLWHDRAVVYVALQKRLGAGAVASEVARTLPHRRAIPSANYLPGSYPGTEDEPTQRGARRPFSPTPAPGPSMARLAEAHAPPARAVAEPLPSFDLPRSGGEIGSGPSQDAVTAPMRNGSALWSALANAPPPQAAFTRDSFDLSADSSRYRAQPAPYGRPVPDFRSGDLSSYEDVTEMDEVFVDVANPEPAVVLEHLARVGVFEPAGGVAPAWERAPKTRNRGTWVLAFATVLLMAAGGGAYTYTKQLKEERAAQARRLTTDISSMLHSGGVAELRATDAKLSQAFELDSRSSDAGRLWLQNRVLGALILPGESRGIDSAVHRGLSVGLSEDQVAFGRIAAFLGEGDLAGAAALLPKWDKKASKDAFYQMTAGAALEAAGDLRAIERYEAARALDPKLVTAEMLLARLVLLELGPEKGQPIVASLTQKIGDVPTTRALKALVWAVTPERPKEVPTDAQVHVADVEQLPAPLRFVPHVIEALQATEAGEGERASKAIAKGIPSAQSPASASWLGFLAIQAGDEQLARKAALRALEQAAVYPRARVLAARVALLGGRLDEAKKAVEQLEPGAPEVAVVRAVVAYETLDTTELEGAVGAFGDASQPRAELRGLTAAPGVLSALRYPDAASMEAMARPQVPWGELVAVDAALDTGNLKLAEQLVKRWEEGSARPVYSLRVARLRRYQGKAEDAVTASTHALDHGTTTARVLIERVYDLLANEQVPAARQLLARYPTLLGPMTGWLSALVDAAADRKADAAVKVAQLDLPPDAAPVLLKALVARSLSAAGDKRARPYLGTLARRLGKHPDFVLAARE
jgi:tetratricopeptide (TPR) repeat protein